MKIFKIIPDYVEKHEITIEVTEKDILQAREDSSGKGFLAEICPLAKATRRAIKKFMDNREYTVYTSGYSEVYVKNKSGTLVSIGKIACENEDQQINFVADFDKELEVQPQKFKSIFFLTKNPGDVI